MKWWLLLGLVVSLGDKPAMAETIEPGRIINSNPVDVSPEWRKLADQYKRQIDALRAQRGDKKAETAKVQDKLNRIDVGEVFEKSNKEVEENAKDVAQSVGDAAQDYFKDFGELAGIASATKTITTDTLPALKNAIDAFAKPGEAMREQDRLERNMNDLDDSMRSLDRYIDLAQRNMDLSNRIADIYSKQVSDARQQRQKVVFKLVDKAKAVNRAAAINVKHHLDTAPLGWVQCACPSQHSAYGRYIKGVFWHPDDPAVRCH